MWVCVGADLHVCVFMVFLCVVFMYVCGCVYRCMCRALAMLSMFPYKSAHPTLADWGRLWTWQKTLRWTFQRSGTT